ncbi:50S ribosomal protein L13 [Candidatus Collierbacteria bacterium]|nr:50S ribosomal protein L13 [Candidatus Collierbacteria bacterium]
MNMTKKASLTRNWHLIDLDGQVLGRVSTRIASLLIGKGKPNFAPHLDQGDYVVAINADKIRVTGKKATDKIYYSHSGYPGGLKSLTFTELLAKDPRKVIERAVKGMLPKNKLQTPRLRRLKVFKNDNHPYAAHLKSQSEQK